ncbi:unnamed protein product [Arctia plantaginis]|uniref:PiggyBac transposable element-derived protein domain-containing protein n=1 Tax=Arctia plantaginis TaxID=874455 RepID=A0A8S1AX75_ARCPL|nr:unnamed protein product [Arctia plantaginis]
MDEFEKFELTQEDILHLENIEINLLNHSFEVDTDADVQPTKRRCRRIILSESENSDDEISRVIADTVGCYRQCSAPSDIWSEVKGNQRKIIPFTELPGLPTNLCVNMRNASPTDFFQLMVPDSLFNEIADRTNQFAINKIVDSGEAARFARLRKWIPTDLIELKNFFGLILFMGETFHENTQEMNGVRTRVCSWTTEQLQSAFDDIDKKDKGINEIF